MLTSMMLCAQMQSKLMENVSGMLNLMKLSESSVRKTIFLSMASKSQSISRYPYAPLLIILLIQLQSATLSLLTNQLLVVKFKSALSLCCHSAVIQP